VEEDEIDEDEDQLDDGLVVVGIQLLDEVVVGAQLEEEDEDEDVGVQTEVDEDCEVDL